VSFAGLLNPASGNCLDAAGALGLRQCTGSATQRWVAPPGPIVSGVSGMCADTGTASTGNASIWFCGARDWVAQADGTLRAGRSCLDASHPTVTLTDCTGAPAEQWRIHPNGTLTTATSGQCLTDPGASHIAGTRLTVEACATTPGQLWHVE
jgi:hypothetical protein